MAPKVGDEVIVSCDPGRACVMAVDSRYVTIKWPWRTIDASSKYRWNGTYAFPVGSRDWVPFVLEPPVSELRVGDECLLSIPPTRLYVGYFEEYSPPRDLGWAPAPTAGIYVVRPEDREDEEAGCMLYLGGADPIRVDPIKDVRM